MLISLLITFYNLLRLLLFSRFAFAVVVGDKGRLFRDRPSSRWVGLEVRLLGEEDLESGCCEGMLKESKRVGLGLGDTMVGELGCDRE